MSGNRTAAPAYICHSISVEPAALANYSRELQLPSSKPALRALARAVATSLSCAQELCAALVVGTGPRPVLGLLARSDSAGKVWLAGQERALNRVCAHLRYVSYGQAERDCQQLAARLVERFGREAVGQFRYAGLARGGFIALGILAYTLGLERAQLEPPYPPDVPLVVVDDCAFTGNRFSRFLERCGRSQVIFAPLYSHPDLRAAIEAREPQVVACLSARDLHDHGPERLGKEYPAWRQRWLAMMGGRRYWGGQTDHVCFSWSEPDRFIWDSVAENLVRAWHIVPPERYLGNRLPPKTEPIPVQVQPQGKGPLRPSEQVLFGELGGQTVVGNLETGGSFGLDDVAADIWRAIVAYGNAEDVVGALLADYDVGESTLRADLDDFVGDLLKRGLLERSDASDGDC